MKKSSIFSVVLFSFISFQLSGQTWSALKRLTWNIGGSYVPSIATDSGNGTHVVWHDSTWGNREIIYKRSSNGGATWLALTRLTWNAGESKYPSIATDSGSGIHVVWYDYTPGNHEIFYKHSSDGGTTWSSPTRLTWNSGHSWAPSIATDSGNGIHVVWRNDIPGNREIFYKRSTDGGATWSGSIRLTWNVGGSYSPSIATDSSNGIHVVWEDNTPGNREIFYKHSPNGGATWSGPTRLTWNAGDSSSPSIATDSVNGIYVVWYDYTPGNFEIFYKRSTDGGTTWSGLKRLSWNVGGSYSPSIATDSSNGIHVVWRNDSPTYLEIFYKRSSDGGATWSALTRLTWNAGESKYPSIAIGGGIHVVWYDDTPGNYEIFYKNYK